MRIYFKLDKDGLPKQLIKTGRKLQPPTYFDLTDLPDKNKILKRQRNYRIMDGELVERKECYIHSSSRVAHIGEDIVLQMVSYDPDIAVEFKVNGQKQAMKNGETFILSSEREGVWDILITDKRVFSRHQRIRVLTRDLNAPGEFLDDTTSS